MTQPCPHWINAQTIFSHHLSGSQMGSVPSTILPNQRICRLRSISRRANSLGTPDRRECRPLCLLVRQTMNLFEIHALAFKPQKKHRFCGAFSFLKRERQENKPTERRYIANRSLIAPTVKPMAAAYITLNAMNFKFNFVSN